MVWDPSLLYMGWIHGLKTSSQILIKCNRTSFHYHIMEFWWILEKQEDVRNISLWRWYSFWNWSSRSYHQFYGNVEILTHYDRRNVCYRYAEMLRCKKCVEWAYFSLYTLPLTVNWWYFKFYISLSFSVLCIFSILWNKGVVYVWFTCICCVYHWKMRSHSFGEIVWNAYVF